MTDPSRRKQDLEERIRRERLAVLVVNCRSRRASKLRPRAEALIRSRGFTITRTFAVTDPSTLDDVLREAMAEQPPLLVLGSGDGTVASVVDHLAGTNTVLGYLPMGTTNNLARSLGLPMQLRRSVALLETGIVADIDLGLADGDYFANMASIGVSMCLRPHPAPAQARAQPAGVRPHGRGGPARRRRSWPTSPWTASVPAAHPPAQRGQRLGPQAPGSPWTPASTTGGWSPTPRRPRPLDRRQGRPRQALTPNRTLAHKGHDAGERIAVQTDPPQPVEIDGETTGHSGAPQRRPQLPARHRPRRLLRHLSRRPDPLSIRVLQGWLAGRSWSRASPAAQRPRNAPLHASIGTRSGDLTAPAPSPPSR